MEFQGSSELHGRGLRLFPYVGVMAYILPGFVLCVCFVVIELCYWPRMWGRAYEAVSGVSMAGVDWPTEMVLSFAVLIGGIFWLWLMGHIVSMIGCVLIMHVMGKRCVPPPYVTLLGLDRTQDEDQQVILSQHAYPAMVGLVLLSCILIFVFPAAGWLLWACVFVLGVVVAMKLAMSAPVVFSRMPRRVWMAGYWVFRWLSAPTRMLSQFAFNLLDLRKPLSGAMLEHYSRVFYSKWGEDYESDPERAFWLTRTYVFENHPIARREIARYEVMQQAVRNLATAFLLGSLIGLGARYGGGGDQAAVVLFSVVMFGLFVLYTVRYFLLLHTYYVKRTIEAFVALEGVVDPVVERVSD